MLTPYYALRRFYPCVQLAYGVSLILTTIAKDTNERLRVHLRRLIATLVKCNTLAENCAMSGEATPVKMSAAAMNTRITTCPYCCLRRGTTKDHVVPRCLFPKPLPNGFYLPTIKACAECNNIDKSRDETYLRDYLVIHGDCSEHESANTVLTGQVIRSIRKNKSAFVQSLKNPRAVSLRTPSGIYLEQGVVADVDQQSLDRALARIARGFYLKLFNQLLPIDVTFEVLKQDNADIERLITNSGLTWQRPPALLDVFSCLVCYGPPQDASSLWLMEFYNRIWISVRTWKQLA